MDSYSKIVPVDSEEMTFLQILEEKFDASQKLQDFYKLCFKHKTEESNIIKKYAALAATTWPDQKKFENKKETAALKKLAEEIASSGILEIVRQSHSTLLEFRKLRMNAGINREAAVEKVLAIIDFLEKQKKRRNQLLKQTLECFEHITEMVDENIELVSQKKKHLLKVHKKAAIKLRSEAISIAEEKAGITRNDFAHPHPVIGKEVLRAMEVPMNIEKIRSGLCTKFFSIIHDDESIKSPMHISYKTYLCDMIGALVIIRDSLNDELRKIRIHWTSIHVKDLDATILEEVATTFTGFLHKATKNFNDMEKTKKAIDKILSENKMYIAK